MILAAPLVVDTRAGWLWAARFVTARLFRIAQPDFSTTNAYSFFTEGPNQSTVYMYRRVHLEEAENYRESQPVPVRHCQTKLAADWLEFALVVHPASMAPDLLPISQPRTTGVSRFWYGFVMRSPISSR